MAYYKSKFTGAEIDQRLAQGTYDDAVQQGFNGTKTEFDRLLAAYDKTEQDLVHGAQQQVDASLETEHKTIVGAINELHTEVDLKQPIGDYANKGEFEVFKDEVAATYATKGELAEDLAEETNRAIDRENEIESNLNSEIEDRTNADSAIRADLETLNENTVKAIEAANQNRETADVEINAAIAKEIEDRTASDDAISKALTEETKNRTEAVADLTESITETNTALNTEIENRTNAITTVTEALAKETSDRESADTALSERVTAIENADYQSGAQVEATINELIAAAPEALDTLKEIADALNNDPDFAATMTTELSKKVDKIDGKGLSTNDYTTEEKEKLAGLSNYDDAQVKADIESLKTGKQDVGDYALKSEIPTKVSELTNDSGYITEVPAQTWDSITEKPTFATVATSGSYNDLSNKPTIPSVDGLLKESDLKTINGESIVGTGDVDLSIYQTKDDNGLKTNSKSIVPAINELQQSVIDLQNSVPWYGIERDMTDSSSKWTRIGNMDLHKSLPLQNKMKAVLLSDDGTINKYLPDDTWEGEVLDGSEGQLMGTVPDMYVRCEKEGNLVRFKFSEYPLTGFTFRKGGYLSCVEASLQRSTLKLSSVVNLTEDYRGGNNNTAWDNTSRSLLGKPVTAVSRTNFRTYAANRGDGWTQQPYHLYMMVWWMYLLEYADNNAQLAYTAELTSEGYKQGGLGNGVTNISSVVWSKYFTYCPFIPCGYTNDLGNNTGTKAYTMPYEFDCVRDANTATGADNYTGEYSAETVYTVGQYVSYNNNLYKCTTETTAGTEPTDTGYFSAVTRTVTYVPKYRCFENLFGHIWKWTDGYNTEIEANGEGNSSTVSYYTDDYTLFADNTKENYIALGTEPRISGYIKTMNVTDGMFSPAETGGGSTTYFADYYYTMIPSSGVVFRALLVGGHANYGAYAGFGYFLVNNAASYADAHVGTRLAYLK